MITIIDENGERGEDGFYVAHCMRTENDRLKYIEYPNEGHLQIPEIWAIIKQEMQVWFWNFMEDKTIIGWLFIYKCKNDHITDSQLYGHSLASNVLASNNRVQQTFQGLFTYPV